MEEGTSDKVGAEMADRVSVSGGSQKPLLKHLGPYLCFGN
jgi:hypothetical protein